MGSRHFCEITDRNRHQVRCMRKVHFPVIFSHAISQGLLLHEAPIADGYHAIGHGHPNVMREALVGSVNRWKPLARVLRLALCPKHGWLTWDRIHGIDKVQPFRIANRSRASSRITVWKSHIINF